MTMYVTRQSAGKPADADGKEWICVGVLGLWRSTHSHSGHWGGLLRGESHSAEPLRLDRLRVQRLAR